MKVTTVRFDEELEKRLNSISEETDRSRSRIIRKALSLYLERLETELTTTKTIKNLLEQKAVGQP